MKKLILFMLVAIFLCGCTKSTTNEVMNNNATSDNLLQSAMLNEIEVQYYQYNEYYPDELELSEPFYFNEIGFEYYAFSMIDIDFDGQKDVCLYSTTHEEQFLRVLFVKDNKVYVDGIGTEGCVVNEDGYAVGETDKMFLVQKSIWGRGNIDVLKIVYDSNIFQINGEDVTDEEAETYKTKFSVTQPEKYDFTEENIRTYVK